MIRLISFLRSFFNELLIIFLLVFLINNYIGNVDQTIKADGVGYYDYLPSIFIHHDLNRVNLDPVKTPEKFNRIRSLGVYVNYNKTLVNKYPCGTAILEAPFFFLANLNFDQPINSDSGYQYKYHLFIFYAALFYLFLSILLLKKILQLYSCSSSTIVFVQLLLVLGTSVTNYVNYDAGFSHVYSLFAITLLIYLIKKYFVNHNFSVFYAACAILGLVILIRQVNGMVVFFIPFLAGSWPKLKEEIVKLFKNIPSTILGFVILLAVVSVQSLVWYLQTGELFLYSYQGESFNFSKPEIYNVLFSFRKGLFVYTPILGLSAVALIWFIVKRRFFEATSWLFFFLIVTYMVSSWWCWYYGASYGMRVYIDYYSVFFIVIAMVFDKLVLWIKIVLVLPAIFLIYLNIIQTYQYKEYILHWGDMDKDWYWTVFLKTEDKYKGMLWKKQLAKEAYLETDIIQIGNVVLPEQCDSTLANFSSAKLSNIAQADVFQVRISNNFSDENDARIALQIKDTISGNNAYFHERSLLHFNQEGLNSYQAGLFNFELPQRLPGNGYIIKLIASSHSNGLKINDVSIVIYSRK